MFNEAMVGTNQKLEAAGTELGTAIGLAINGGPQELANAKEKYAKTVRVVQQVKADMQTLKVPSSKSAQTLYEAHQKFLQGQERMIQDDFGEILKTLEDPALDKTAKTQKLQAIFKRVEQAAQDDLIPLQNAQKEFARENNLNVALAHDAA